MYLYLCDPEEITCYYNGKSGQMGYGNSYYAGVNVNKYYK